MWISTDPALGDYIPKAPTNEEAKKHNQNLPGMGGVFNHINGDLYAYAGNNPVKYTDPDGKSPVYDTNGSLIGVTEDSGLQGKPFFMNAEDYSPKMSTEDANKRDLGMTGLKNETAIKNFIANFSNLNKRPDWDGKLTLSEANEWYRNGNGRELFVDINKIDLSMYASLGDKYIGKIYAFNLQMDGSSDGLVFGNLTFKRYANDACRAYSDTYDFEYHKGISSMPRNVATFFGRLYAGKGTSYIINIYGEKRLQRAWWAR